MKIAKKPIKEYRSSLGKRIWNNKLLYLLLVPALLNFGLFHYGPMGGLVIAFKNYTIGVPIDMAPWVGFQNFIDFFESYYFVPVTMNTLIISFLILIFGFPAPIILALALNEIRRPAFKRIVQTISYVPYFISSVIIVGLIILMLNPSDGVFNNMIRTLGGQPISFIEDPRWFRTVYVCMTIWQGTGFGAIIYLSAISAVDSELYEAAIIDGAGRLARLWHITVMSILPTIMIMFILKIGTILNIGWMEVLLMQNNVNSSVSEVMQTMVYKRGLINANYGYATAVGLLMSVVSLVLMLVSNGAVKHLTNSEMSLF
jgi:putative aldouronate transport system permease protein